MNRVELRILKAKTTKASGNNGSSLQSHERAIINKWKFQDSMMGEQFITFTITSETPIDWEVGDFCVFRGETFTLNYIPSVTQKSRAGERQDAYTYENVKFDSFQEELTRVLMLDITSTTGDYVAAMGTNYTGSSKFQLFCGETSVNGKRLTAVCVLAAKIQANLDRAYPSKWNIYVDTTSTYINASGRAEYVTHTEDQVLSFDNTSVAKALAEVHNTFNLNYCIKGRNIYIGCNLKNLTSDNADETFVFGYGKGYPTKDDMNTGLFKLKRISESNQKIATRLRAMGSTRNLPYRYYNEKYNLSQSLFPTNLQLPDTFESPSVKSERNGNRDEQYGINELSGLPYLRHVQGDTNDAYIDKDDDAENCSEGVREDSACWDGSNKDLPEIYPTIADVTYGELRGTSVKDQNGISGVNAFSGYGNDEHVDELLAIGYMDSKENMVDDANDGDGILPENYSGSGMPILASIGQKFQFYRPNASETDFTPKGDYYVGKEETLLNIENVLEGKYSLVPSNGNIYYGFGIYRTGASTVFYKEVGFMLTIKSKSKNSGETKTIATYKSEFVSARSADNRKYLKLPTLPDVGNGETQQVKEIHVTEHSDITVTVAPIFRHKAGDTDIDQHIGFKFLVGSVASLEYGVDYSPEYTWMSVDGKNDNGAGSFHVFIKDMGFDLKACFTGETPVLAMKSGRCVAREFEIGKNISSVTYEGKKGYVLTLNRATDSTLNTYYPSETDPIAAGDKFVLLNICMPDAYVESAELRLLRAATDYLADNCTTRFTYQPYIDDIYLQRNYDNMVAAGSPENSIFWRLYAGLKFTFRGIPEREDHPLPLIDLTIEQITINMGDGMTPKVEMTLNDDVQQTTLQKLTISVDRIYNGSLFSNGSGTGTGTNAAALLSILQSEGGKLFVSKRDDDVVDGKISFNDVVTHNANSKFKKGLTVGNFNSRMLGSGAIIDEHGNAEFESIYSRNFISTPEFRFNKVGVTDGEQWCTNGYGTIQNVEKIDDTTGYITLKLEENDYASVWVGDICRGIYNDYACQYETANLDDDSSLYDNEEETDVINDKEGVGFGFSSKEGFFTSYFWIKQMVSNRRGECKFLYELRNSKTPHPCEFMKFAQYGSFTNSERRSSSYSTSIGHYYEMVLDGVSTWKIQSANVVYRKGFLGNMSVTLKNGKEATLQGYGLYVQDNVYFGNAIVQLDPETLGDIEAALSNYTVEFSEHVDLIVVDDVGNAIGGLYTIDGDARRYRIQSAITVRNNNKILTIAPDDDDASDGTYKIYAQGNGCTCIVEDSTLYITSIENIKDGVSGSDDDVDFDYDAMRNMESCSVDIIIDCEGKGSIVKSFPIRIKHDSQPYVSVDMDNEFSGVSWNTKEQVYFGLPIDLNMSMWHNNELLDITAISVNGTKGACAPETPVYITVSGIKLLTNLSISSKNGVRSVHGLVRIISLPDDLALVTNLNITCTAVYAGVSYERTLVHTINKSTDLNVYSLLPSVSEVVVDKNTDTLSDNLITCDVICDSTDHKHYKVDYSDFKSHGLVMYYRKYYTDGSSDKNETLYENTAISLDGSVSKVSFYLYGLNGEEVDRTIIHDSEDVPVIPSGVDGKIVEFIFITMVDWDGEDSTRPTIYYDGDEWKEDDYLPYTDEKKSAQWADEPIGVDENVKYEFYAQRKKVNGVWQEFGKVKIWDRYSEGPAGPAAKSIYKNSFSNPGTPWGTSPSGWTDDIITQAAISVEHQGDWVKETDGWRIAPPIGDEQESIQIVKFTTTEQNQKVYLSVLANIEPRTTYVYISDVDEENESLAITGYGQILKDHMFTVIDQGSHFIRIRYVRIEPSYSDLSCYVKYKFGIMPTWRSDAKGYNANGVAFEWSAPYQITQYTDDDKTQTRPNLLLQTSFLYGDMDKWVLVLDGGYTTSGIDGMNAFVGTNNTSAYKELLKQLIHDKNTSPYTCKVRPETWYTLSFWAKTAEVKTNAVLATYLYPDADQSTYTYIDTKSGLYVDGIRKSATNSTDNNVSWILTTQWTRHWMAFKTASHLSDTANQQLLFRLLANAGTVYVCMPKLEQGIGATAYCRNDSDIIDRAASESGFPNDRGVWVKDTTNDPLGKYKWNDTRRDYVEHEINGVYYSFFVKSKGMEVPDNSAPVSGGNDYWEQASKVSTLLVNTIVGTNACLNFAKSNRIYITNSNGEVALGLGGAENGDNDFPLWIGATYENRANASFRVSLLGKLYATNAEISGKIFADEGRFGNMIISDNCFSSQNGVLVFGKVGDSFTRISTSEEEIMRNANLYLANYTGAGHALFVGSLTNAMWVMGKSKFDGSVNINGAIRNNIGTYNGGDPTIGKEYNIVLWTPTYTQFKIYLHDVSSDNDPRVLTILALSGDYYGYIYTTGDEIKIRYNSSNYDYIRTYKNTTVTFVYCDKIWYVISFTGQIFTP